MLTECIFYVAVQNYKQTGKLYIQQRIKHNDQRTVSLGIPPAKGSTLSHKQRFLPILFYCSTLHIMRQWKSETFFNSKWSFSFSYGWYPPSLQKGSRGSMHHYIPHKPYLLRHKTIPWQKVNIKDEPPFKHALIARGHPTAPHFCFPLCTIQINFIQAFLGGQRHPSLGTGQTQLTQNKPCKTKKSQTIVHSKVHTTQQCLFLPEAFIDLPYLVKVSHRSA